MSFSASEVAKWMAEELHRVQYLEQEVAVGEIEHRFGQEFVYINESGGQSISREVLREFRKLTEDTAVWVRSEKTWRFREPSDEPGRKQD